jgi:hypothetical protein
VLELGYCPEGFDPEGTRRKVAADTTNWQEKELVEDSDEECEQEVVVDGSRCSVGFVVLGRDPHTDLLLRDLSGDSRCLAAQHVATYLEREREATTLCKRDLQTRD